MDKKTIYHIIEWGIAIGACVYLAYKLITFDDYADLWRSLRTMTLPQWTALLLAVLLMPVNMSLEAWRWRYLIPMSWREAHRQVYYSKLAGLITPWRLGEYPARAAMMDSRQPSTLNSHDTWAQVLSMGAVGSVTMTAAIVLGGVFGLAFSPELMALLGHSYLYSLGIVIVLGIVVMGLLPKLLSRYASVSNETMLVSTLQSLVRLACWCVQLSLLIWAFTQSPISNLKSPIYYLLVTITPNVPLVELGVRGAWAIALFGNVNAALAGVLLWVINTLLPCLVALAMRKK